MTLSEQLSTFILTVVIGLLAGFSYDFYRVVRRLTRPRKVGTFLGDLLFWLLLMVFVFGLLLIINHGEVRFYILLGMALGAAIHFSFFSQPAYRLIYRLIRFIRQIIELILSALCFVWRLSTFPFRILMMMVAFPFHWAGRGLSLAGHGIGRVGKGIFGSSLNHLSGRWRQFTGRWCRRK